MTDKNRNVVELEDVVIRFSGDSGDGMQLTGTLFSDASALFGNNVATFPDFPAEHVALLRDAGEREDFPILHLAVFGIEQTCRKVVFVPSREDNNNRAPSVEARRYCGLVF